MMKCKKGIDNDNDNTDKDCVVTLLDVQIVMVTVLYKYNNEL